jgi:1-aminocyclopropane-1-carboxylate deaminase/D-cysteine desulfhydrase-like pyridoxal-dependent ACC family enzyme
VSNFLPFIKSPQKKPTLHSRVHLLKGLCCFVKREDELSFGISGPKLRKLVPLIKALKKEKGAIFYGSAYSNFILGAVQLLIENEIDYTLVLKKAHTTKVAGNLQYLLRMVPKEKIIWESGSLPEDYRIIPEGGDVPECLEGAKSLAASIYQNEKELGSKFSKIVIDAGTGISALGLILGLQELGETTPVHVFSMKLSKEEFFQKLSSLKIDYPVFFHELTHNKSFGAVNTSLLHFINDFAKKEGFFLDPIYSGKLFYELMLPDHKNLIDHKTLVIHSGGALALSGFDLSG